MLAPLVFLAGCSTFEAITPVSWWHDLQGGKIAEERPPPPGADAAYPNLSTVPERPKPPDREEMRRLTDALVADRTNARYSAAAAPIADPSSPAASPALFGAGTMPPPAKAPPPSAMSASLPAADAPPAAPPAPPSKAPMAPVQAATLDAPSDATPPPLPTQAPARAAASGAAPAPVPPSGAVETSAEPVPFAARSAKLSPAATAAVQQYAARRNAALIVVTGHGDAASSDPATQTAAVSLGFARAQAVADVLTEAGVPPNLIRVGSEAAGRGATLQLLQ